MVHRGLWNEIQETFYSKSFIAGSHTEDAVIATHDRPDLSSTAFKRVSERFLNVYLNY
jgi:hypothetical protein